MNGDTALRHDPPYTAPNGYAWPIPPRGGYTFHDLCTLELPPHTQLIDGSLVLPVPQTAFHSVCGCLLADGLRRTVPSALKVRRQMCVRITDHNVPEPDIIVVTAESDLDDDQLHYEVTDVVLAVEVVSPDSESRDRDTKPHKYAAAGIAHFWRVEMTDEDHHPLVHVHELDPASKSYALTGIHRDQLTVPAPYPISIDLTELARY